MRRIAVRRVLRVLLVSCAALAAGGTGTALATTVEYSGDGATLIVTGADDVNHEIQFRLSADRAHDEIIDTVAFTSIPGDCTVVNSPTWISCPGRLGVKVDLGAGNDRVFFAGTNSDCFSSYVLNLGDGANTLDLSDQCQLAGDTATVTSGSGSDVLTGGSQSAVTFFAGGGDDSVYAGSGDDILHGGEGADRLFGGAGTDQVLGEGGADTPTAGPGTTSWTAATATTPWSSPRARRAATTPGPAPTRTPGGSASTSSGSTTTRVA